MSVNLPVFLHNWRFTDFFVSWYNRNTLICLMFTHRFEYIHRRIENTEPGLHTLFHVLLSFIQLEIDSKLEKTGNGRSFSVLIQWRIPKRVPEWYLLPPAPLPKWERSRCVLPETREGKFHDGAVCPLPAEWSGLVADLEMVVNEVSTRQVAQITKEFWETEFSKFTVSNLDSVVSSWNARPLQEGCIKVSNA
jgi:hypothetical protein